MHYDVVIIGAGMSGLAAGIRLAHFDHRVCIVEQHHAVGGLNSYYKLGDRWFDVGLHALTNYVPPDRRSTPLAKLLRQLRLSRDEFDLCEQRFSEVQFPSRRLRFTNDLATLTEEVAREFPGEIDRFHRLLTEIDSYEDTRLDQPYCSARETLTSRLHDPTLVEMLLCPTMYYGSADERDMDFTQFVTMFKSLFCEGLARPRGGVRTIIRALVRRFRACGGKFMLSNGVEQLNIAKDCVASIALQSGETLTADVIISSAGFHETMRLCSDRKPKPDNPEIGRVSFVETIFLLDRLPADLGHEPAIVFYNDADSFTYARPDELVDPGSGVVCCPNNYARHDDMPEGILRLTWLANYQPWMEMGEDGYRAAKSACLAESIRCGERFVPGLRDRITATDMFTPRTIHRFTGHLNGAVYGSPRKTRDGQTHLKNLFICGTDQGFLGIIGAMLSGITIANLHVLSKT